MIAPITLNSSGVCSGCGGRVRNIEGKRHTVERLAAIHAESCAARRVGASR